MKYPFEVQTATDLRSGLLFRPTKSMVFDDRLFNPDEIYKVDSNLMLKFIKELKVGCDFVFVCL